MDPWPRVGAGGWAYTADPDPEAHPGADWAWREYLVTRADLEATVRALGTGALAGWSLAGTTAAGRERQDRRRPFGGADRDPATVSTVFGRLIRDRGWSTPVAVGSVLTRWAELVGPEIALHCRPESFEDSVVRVRTSSTAWATQLRLMSPVLLQRFDEALGPGVVTRIEVAGPQAPSWRRGPRTVRGGRGPRDTYG
ncbi:DUF721 domain-containing protein [Micrococcus sp. HSID17227]|uniref:DUF721 domain-containing protein n=1 Tax=Micrococcus sp. HSID17227 TaxID=2419506 RepID=UPI00351AAB47